MSEAPEINAAHDQPPPSAAQAALHFLHIEDDDGDAKIIQRAFAREFGKAGHTITRTDTLTDALRQLRAGVFDAVLLDLGLGDSAGLSGMGAIKEEYPDLPIIILSGLDDTETALNAVRGGAQDYLVKGHGDSRMLALAVMSSIERKRHERHLFRLANHDELTGLPNRRMFLEYLKHWLIRAERWHRQEAIMFMDVNGFKQVNDTLGHDIGDQLLVQIAARLKIGLRASDTLARFGGDEFIVHLDLGSDVLMDVCVHIAEKIAALFETPILIAGHPVKTGVSIGIAVYPDHGRDSAGLIRTADEAMYQAKRQKLSFALAPQPPLPSHPHGG